MSGGVIAQSRWFPGSLGAGMLLGLVFLSVRPGMPHADPGEAVEARRVAAAVAGDPAGGDRWRAARAGPVATVPVATDPVATGPVADGSGARPVFGREAAGPVSGRRGGVPLFGLARPGRWPGEVLFARARREQPGGPETVRAAEPAPFAPVRLAPDAEVWLTAPLADRRPTDYIKGVKVTPEAFGPAYRTAQQRLGGVVDARAHMFELWLDDQGRVVRLRHYFSP